MNYQKILHVLFWFFDSQKNTHINQPQHKYHGFFLGLKLPMTKY